MSQITETLDQLFRRESSKIVSCLTRILGASQIDVAESLVQEALVKAIQNWPIHGIPDNPAAWLMQTSKNLTIDYYRKNKKFVYDVDDYFSQIQSSSVESFYQNEMIDNQLRMMFVCCHPMLSKESQLALTLKTIFGFSVKEVAKAFLCSEETVAQRIVRAKQKILTSQLPYEVPPPSELSSRLDSVLEVLYLLFNEGYLATEGHNLIRKDLCEEAIYRLELLCQHPVTQTPKAYALLALMHLQTARFNARLDLNGDILILEEQDRTLWDPRYIAEGLKYLDKAATGEELSVYHLQAGISACHTTSPSFEATDWVLILNYYDILLTMTQSAVVALNRCVALSMVKGLDEGINALFKIRNEPELKNYYLLYATMAELYRRNKNYLEAIAQYQKAEQLVGTEPEKKLIRHRIELCRNQLKI